MEFNWNDSIEGDLSIPEMLELEDGVTLEIIGNLTVLGGITGGKDAKLVVKGDLNVAYGINLDYLTISGSLEAQYITIWKKLEYPGGPIENEDFIKIKEITKC